MSGSRAGIRSPRVRPVLRFYAAVHEGVVVGARTTVKRFTHVMLHTNINGTFATFHLSLQAAVESRRSFVSHPVKNLGRAFETRRRLVVGADFTPADVLEPERREVDGETTNDTPIPPPCPTEN